MRLPPQDKLLHFVAGQAVGLLVFHIAPADPTFPALVALLVGLLKECYDALVPGHTVDPWDAVATTMGVVPLYLMR